jgi:hypothetical protein
MTIRKPPHFFLLLVASWTIFVSSVIIWDILLWTDHFTGFVAGMGASLFYSIGWGIYILPLNLVVGFLYRWKKWRRFRAAFVLAPSVIIACWSFLGLALHPPTGRNLFYQDTGVAVPGTATNFLSFLSGAGFGPRASGGRRDHFYFQCNPTDTKNLIAALKLEKADRSALDLIADVPGLPSPFSWPSAHFYQRIDSVHLVFITVVTDKNEGQFYMDYMD